MMDTAEIDEWLTHLQREVDSIGDQLHQLVTALITIGVFLVAIVAIVALVIYALTHGAA